ncbi:MAG: hypothetical protein IAE85_13915 [Anaerolinea sp.]|nr:hypothetical protein [Anaerolinea sp.]
MSSLATTIAVDQPDRTAKAPCMTVEPIDDATLVNALGAVGLRHLSIAEPAAPYEAVDATTLVAGLAGHADPRLREALMPLFLRHPDLAVRATELVERLEPEAADTLRHFYTAAVFLQRLWLSTLRLHLGNFPLLSDHFGQRYYHLSAPDVKFGEAGLRGLARLYADKTGMDWLSVYQATMTLFLQQLSLDEARHDG